MAPTVIREFMPDRITVFLVKQELGILKHLLPHGRSNGGGSGNVNQKACHVLAEGNLQAALGMR